MLGMLRQEIIFARRQKELGQSPGWISVPLIVTSHTWENSKNEQSHQDPTIGEALLGEMSDTARVLFPVDANTATAALRDCLRQPRAVACIVVSKRDTPNRFTAEAAQSLLAQGDPCGRRPGHRADTVRGRRRLPVRRSPQGPCAPGPPRPGDRA